MASRLHPARIILPAAVAVSIATALAASTLAFSPAARPRADGDEPTSAGQGAPAGVLSAGLPVGVGPLPSVTPEVHPADLPTIFRGGVPRWMVDRASIVGPATWPTSTAASGGARPTSGGSPQRTAEPATPATHAATATVPAYQGRNHVWIPALGVSRSVSWFSCSRSTPPGNAVYRWGCAGRNNVYLFGHAYSAFKALHDAYVRKQLRVGMTVVYADGAGRVRTYRVTFWRVVSPVNSGWAYAAQSRPSMTLQTCVGSNSQYRLVVRLVASG